MYSFPFAAVMNYHMCNSLNRHQFILVLEVRHLRWCLKSRGQQGCVPSRGSRGELASLSSPVSRDGLVALSAVFKASRVLSSSLNQSLSLCTHTHPASITAPLPDPHNDSYNYNRPTQIIRNNLPTSLASTKSLSPCKVPNPQARAIRMRTIVGAEGFILSTTMLSMVSLNKELIFVIILDLQKSCQGSTA